MAREHCWFDGCEPHNHRVRRRPLRRQDARTRVADMRVCIVAVLLSAWLDACVGRPNTPTPVLLLASPRDTLRRTGTTHEVSDATRSRVGWKTTRKTRQKETTKKNCMEYEVRNARASWTSAERVRWNRRDVHRETLTPTNCWNTS